MAGNLKGNISNKGRGSFKKGQSGNPGGRSKAWHEVQRAAQAEGTESIRLLVRLRDNGDTQKIQIMAAVALLDRGFGKPATTIYVGDAPERLEEMSDEELLIIARGEDQMPEDPNVH